MAQDKGHARGATGTTGWNGRPLRIDAAGREWIIDREADLEELWEAMTQDDLDDDERLPYWAEIWPASVLLADWLGRMGPELSGRRCLDMGCGLGLTALAAQWLGARVVAVDYEFAALAQARRNARLNQVDQPLWVCMDWRSPGLALGAFDYVWGGDIFYETRFFEPVEALLRGVLAPGGTAFIGDPERTVSRPVWNRLRDMGWNVEQAALRKVRVGGMNQTVRLWRLTRRTAT